MKPFRNDFVYRLRIFRMMYVQLI